MWRIRTASRLHFGLLNLGGDSESSPRRFGGAGLMIESPGLSLCVEPGPKQIVGPLAERVASFASSLGDPDCRLIVERAPPDHAGLGTGTQLALAVGRVVSLVTKQDQSTASLARMLGRGHRSSIGIHGFDQGGFLVDAGKGPDTTIAPLVARLEFPAWPVLVVVPRGSVGLHGEQERDAFTRLSTCPRTVEILCRLVLLAMLPAIQEQNFRVFCESVHEFNRRAGECFAPVQGGVYASRQVAEVVDFLRSRGVTGVGQSSWGPGVFAFVEDQQQARRLAHQLSGLGEVIVTRACNRGAIIEQMGNPDQ